MAAALQISRDGWRDWRAGWPNEQRDSGSRYWPTGAAAGGAHGASGRLDNIWQQSPVCSSQLSTETFIDMLTDRLESRLPHLSQCWRRKTPNHGVCLVVLSVSDASLIVTRVVYFGVNINHHKAAPARASRQLGDADARGEDA